MSQEHMFAGSKTLEEKAADVRERLRRSPDRRLFARVSQELMLECLAPGCPPQALKVYCVLHLLAGRDGTTRRDKEGVAKAIGIAKSTLTSTFKWLEDHGHVRRVVSGNRSTWIVCDQEDHRASPSGRSVGHKRPVSRSLATGQSVARGDYPEGDSSTNWEGAPPEVAPSTQDWLDLFALYPGRKTQQAVGSYFNLARLNGWGAEEIRKRVEFTVQAHAKLDRTLPQLLVLLKASNERLADPWLDGLQEDLDRAARGRR